jgi:hypothetical protein
MASLNPSTNISAYIQDIYEGALMMARENNLLASLVTPFNDREGLALRKNSQYGGVTINQVAETDDLVGQAFTPSVIATLTPYEFGAQYVLTDSRVESDPFPVRADASTDLGMAMATKIDSDLAATFSSLTGGTVGAAGTAITWGHFFAMLSRLRAQLAPPPYVFVVHPYQWHVLGKAVAPGVTVTNAPRFQDAITTNFYQASVAGVDIYTTANITIDGSGDAYCGMFSRQALALDVRRAPRLEVERDASRRAWELNLTAVYAAGVWRPDFGIQGLFDAATPSS